MKRKYGIIFGAIAITLLMISNATAITTPQLDENSETENNVSTTVTNHVEPGIYLNGPQQKETLENALPFIEDHDFRILIQEIIQEMNNGPVNSDDIEQIINDNDLAVGTITTGEISTTGSGPYPYVSGGAAYCPRRLLCGIIVISSLLIPLLYLRIHAHYCYPIFNEPGYPVQITLGGRFIGSEVFVNVIGFWGCVGCNIAPEQGFFCEGAGLIINYRMAGSQQSTTENQSKTESSSTAMKTTTSSTTASR